MWFRQIQLFQISSGNFSVENIIEKLKPLAFHPCSPSMPQSMGWASPWDDDADDAPLVRAINGNIMLCLQIEEKILPATVVRQELINKIKKTEAAEHRKIRQKEKLSLRDEIIMSLLPRAFSKLAKIYGYIDTKNRRLVLGTTSTKKTEQFLSMFKKALDEEAFPLEVKKISPIMTQWLQHQNYPSTLLSVEKSGVLHDPAQENRVIRCQQQDLFANGIQTLLKDGFAAKQLALCWQDRVNFVLSDGLLLQKIKYQEEIIAQANEMEPETKQQQFDADFLIMTETLSALLKDLLDIFKKEESSKSEINGNLEKVAVV